ncbi:IclR family transcriptional regulator [Paraoerskovia marina]|uniref:IclR family transcriptional regulator n=1 Tax=Paraoerskovia marina TaxID=545619 RepID=UPI000492AED8|nr:IclR family transcriptional regulator [Paraoerskovia marina]
MTNPLGSVDKALLALEVLAPLGPDGLSLGEIARRLDVAKPTVHRTLASLAHRGYVQNDEGRYRLGPAAIALSTAYYAEENLPTLMRPALEAARDELHELVHLGAPAGADEVIYLDKVEPSRPLRVWSAVGRRIPAQTSALGRALRTGRSAEEVEENEPGIACVALPLLRNGNAFAAVSVTAPSERLDVDDRPRVLNVLATTLRAHLPPTITVPDPRADAPHHDRL